MRRAQAQTLRDKHLPAPIGGQNAVSPASAMGPLDASYVYNVIPDDKGLRVRLGYQEWVTGLTGGIDGRVASMLAFTGSAENGSGNKLFAVTSGGIWDVSASTASPSQSLAFTSLANAAGYGTASAFSTLAGRFLIYCDEENGLHVYSESSATWTAATAGTTQEWEASTDYIVGDRVTNSGNIYECITAGTSDSSGGPTTSGADITDGDAHWKYISAIVSQVIGPSLADQQAGFELDPANLAYVTVWKSRLWLVEKNTSRAWYGGVNSIFGTYTSFDFGSRMKAGGPLVGLYNWSYDGGSGLDTLLVGVSGGGDIVIYQGTDPTSASTFGLKGVWTVGGVPKGRSIATDTGGDLLVISSLGVVPLSRLVVGGEEFDQSQYATAKIGPVFTRLVSLYGGYRGWAIVTHPTDNALLVLVPTGGDGQPGEQVAMSFASKGWFPYRDLPMISAVVWNGELYFGTADGRVCRHTGYVDDVKLDDATDYDAVSFSTLTAYSNLGSARNKQVQLIRPVILSETPNAQVQTAALYDYDFNEPSATGLDAGGGGDSAWDEALWDSAVWGGEHSTSQPIGGAAGMGRAVAISIQGEAIGRTTIVGVDVMWTEGGVL